jgi:hypothetical protein
MSGHLIAGAREWLAGMVRATGVASVSTGS